MGDFILTNHFADEILPRLYDADQVKLLLYVQARIAQQEGENRYLFLRQIVNSTTLAHWFGGMEIENRIRQAIKQAIQSGLLLSAKHASFPQRILIFQSDQTGKSSLQRLEQGLWQPTPTDHPVEDQAPPEKNIYQLYEENIGPLTPLLSEDLTAAQEEYPYRWIEEAIHIAVQNNARSWRYVDAVLKSWQKEGKHVQPRRDSQTPESRRSKSSEYDDYIQH